MGHIRHHSIIVTGMDKESVATAHHKAKELFAAVHEPFSVGSPTLVSDVVKTGMNGFSSFFVAPDGSSEGWETSERGDSARTQFLLWLNSHRESLFYIDWVAVQFGDDNNHTILLEESLSDAQIDDHSDAAEERSLKEANEGPFGLAAGARLKPELVRKKLEEMRDGTWIPPIKRYNPPSSMPVSGRFVTLEKHHEEETKILFEELKELAEKTLDYEDALQKITDLLLEDAAATFTTDKLMQLYTWAGQALGEAHKPRPEAAKEGPTSG